VDGRPESGDRKLRVIPPPLFFLTCLAIAWVVHARVPLSFAIEHKTALWIGVGLMGAGALIGGLALGEMKKLKTPPEPWRRPVRLASGGPFRFSRNPIYVAFLFILAAIGMMLNSVWIVGSTVLLWIALDRFVV
jgi:protein-S-isoprenylcysteine O-methyltransferase Ste14